MSTFAFESPTIHGVDRLTAMTGPTISGIAPLALTLLDAAGNEAVVHLFAAPGAEAYARDLARAINRVADAHGRLTTRERINLTAERQLASVLHAAE